MRSKFTPEVIDWICRNYSGSRKEIIQRMHDELGMSLSMHSLNRIACILRNKGLSVGNLNKQKAKYNDEFYEWLSKNYKGSCKEVLKKIESEFGYQMTKKRLQTLANEGRKKHGYDIPRLGNDAGKWRKKTEAKPGTIKKRKKGYYIKLKNGEWYAYHRYVYEQKYGKAPKGMYIIHINGDLFDNNINNLAMVPKPIFNYLALQQFHFDDREMFETACKLAELATLKPKRRKKKNGK